MPRPELDHPTPAELEVLHVLWQRGPCTVRDVMEALGPTRKRRAYTSVMSLMSLMYDKRLLKRRPAGRAFLYEARVSRSKTLGQMIGDLCRRAFSDSASSLVSHMLDQRDSSPDELQAIRDAIDAYQEREQT